MKMCIITGEMVVHEILSKMSLNDKISISEIETLSSDIDPRVGDLWNEVMIMKKVCIISVVEFCEIIRKVEQMINLYAENSSDKLKYILINDGDYMENRL